jgi:uncharacterized protein (TIGR02145 family)
MFKSIFNAVVAVSTCFMLFNCAGGTKPSELAGQWEHASGATSEKPENLELFKDGTGVVDGNISISWKIENKRFVVLSPMFVLSCNYKVSGYELTLAYDNGDSAIFVKKGKLEEFKAKQIAAQIATEKRAIEQLPKFKDSRDNKVYRKVTIGGQTWMAENLNYAANNSVCNGNNADNCAKYGRLYYWATAKTACPAGWHLPNDNEWVTLMGNVGGSKTAGKKLKSTAGWNENGNGTNEYLFSALPGGSGGRDGYFNSADDTGVWWSATEYDDGFAFYWMMGSDREYVLRIGNHDKENLFSVRCVQDWEEVNPPQTRF